MTLDDVLNKAKGWINPSHPGRGKSTVLVTLLGFLLGPIGVGLALRSFVDFGLSLVLAILLMTITGIDGAWAGSLAGAAWALGRVLYDNKDGIAAQHPPSAAPAST